MTHQERMAELRKLYDREPAMAAREAMAYADELAAKLESAELAGRSAQLGMMTAPGGLLTLANETIERLKAKLEAAEAERADLRAALDDVARDTSWSDWARELVAFLGFPTPAGKQPRDWLDAQVRGLQRSAAWETQEHARHHEIEEQLTKKLEAAEYANRLMAQQLAETGTTLQEAAERNLDTIAKLEAAERVVEAARLNETIGNGDDIGAQFLFRNDETRRDR